MKTIEVNFRQWQGEEKINFPESGILQVKPIYKKEWSCSHTPLSVDLIVNGEKIKYENKWNLDMFHESVADRILHNLTKNGYYASIIDYDKYWYGTKRDWEIEFDINNRYSLLYDMLTAIPNPKLLSIVNVTNSYVIVNMVGKSTHNDVMRAAAHIKEINELIPCRIEFVDKRSHWFGSDLFTFKIHTKGIKRFKKR